MFMEENNMKNSNLNTIYNICVKYNFFVLISRNFFFTLVNFTFEAFKQR